MILKCNESHKKVYNPFYSVTLVFADPKERIVAHTNGSFTLHSDIVEQITLKDLNADPYNNYIDPRNCLLSFQLERYTGERAPWVFDSLAPFDQQMSGDYIHKMSGINKLGPFKRTSSELYIGATLGMILFPNTANELMKNPTWRDEYNQTTEWPNAEYQSKKQSLEDHLEFLQKGGLVKA